MKNKTGQAEGRTQPGDKNCVCIIAPVECYSSYRYFRLNNEYDQCPNQFIFSIQLLITYLSAIETHICHAEIKFDKVYFLQFCTKCLARFSKYGIELLVALSWTNASKRS